MAGCTTVLLLLDKKRDLGQELIWWRTIFYEQQQWGGVCFCSAGGNRMWNINTVWRSPDRLWETKRNERERKTLPLLSELARRQWPTNSQNHTKAYKWMMDGELLVQIQSQIIYWLVIRGPGWVSRCLKTDLNKDKAHTAIRKQVCFHPSVVSNQTYFFKIHPTNEDSLETMEQHTHRFN